MVILQSVQLEHSDSLSQGVTAVVHGFIVHALGPRVDKGVYLVDCNADGGGHIVIPRLELILKILKLEEYKQLALIQPL